MTHKPVFRTTVNRVPIYKRKRFSLVTELILDANSIFTTVQGKNLPFVTYNYLNFQTGHKSGLQTNSEKFLMKSPNKTLPNQGIGPRTSYSALNNCDY